MRGFCVCSDGVSIVFDDIHREENWSEERSNVGEEVGEGVVVGAQYQVGDGEQSDDDE